MKKLNEIKETVDSVIPLIDKMRNEITTLRAIVYRYHLMHEGRLQNKNINLPDNFSFALEGDINEIHCRLVDSKMSRQKSNYEEILQEIKNFE